MLLLQLCDVAQPQRTSTRTVNLGVIPPLGHNWTWRGSNPQKSESSAINKNKHTL